MKAFKYVSLFIAIQALSLVLFIIGIPICAVLAYGDFSKQDFTNGLYHWPKWAWLFDNQEDGTCPLWYQAQTRGKFVDTEFRWTAFRNSVNNLRYVPGISGVGRPYWRKTWGAVPGGFYAHAGWNASGFPVLSAGRNNYAY